MFTVEMLPAQRGDCLWLTYGEEPELRHVLIDAGPSETRETLVPQLEDRIRVLPGRRRTNLVELFVISHIDADHIQGVVSLLSGPGAFHSSATSGSTASTTWSRPRCSARPMASS